LPPQWDLKQALKMAAAAESALQGGDYEDVLRGMYGDKPNLWSSSLRGLPRLRFIINSFTRMRYCNHFGQLDFEHNGPPGSQPKELMPWFKVPGRLSRELRIVFGHWSSLGYYAGDNCYGIDTGCLWGGQLTAIKLGDKVERFSLDCGKSK
jgi:bis(5'-nucleosyl)-tetraphosphatase (symmetrical)